MNPVGPRGVYDEAKRFAEAMTMAYHRAHGVDTRIVRIFNTYGPRMRPNDGRVVSNFLIQALAGKPLTVYGDGRQTRSFCFVADTVEGIVRLLLSAEVDPVNIGNPTEFTIAGLIATIERVLGHALPVTYEPLPQDDPRVRQPDITRARTLLGWEPRVDLETGLRETIAYLPEADTGVRLIPSEHAHGGGEGIPLAAVLLRPDRAPGPVSGWRCPLNFGQKCDSVAPFL